MGVEGAAAGAAPGAAAGAAPGAAAGAAPGAAAGAALVPSPETPGLDTVPTSAPAPDAPAPVVVAV